MTLATPIAHPRRLACAALVLLLTGAGQSAAAQEVRAGALRLTRARARPTMPGQPVGGGYLTIENPGTVADRLMSVSAAVSRRVELHSMVMDGDVMRMREMASIDLPPGETVALKPGGLHIMFIGLKAPFKAGDRFPLRLKFERAGEVVVEVLVEAP